ncbi:MAG: dUTP diphosphatase [Bdellovibrionales bacterium]|nr:dUTP diphosphatase [Bdellovibrionales bacterium]
MATVKVIKLNEEAVIPQYMSAGASGCDVCACLTGPLTIAPQQRVAVPTGLAVEIPVGYEIQVRPRSGLSFKQGLTVVNAPGTIDSDYRGEIKILVINLGKEAITIEPGSRIAQLVLQQVEQIQWLPAQSLESTTRDAGGFGSTGV